ncbi:orotidine-5'-phosphate decarboxylase [uncultured Hymenobacter sp.]|uniref:orotidine-5'-phosphate decarboxylase n=1 Tax=uncultured Hymenobacter sp. TaxID=170016 RepID=UPI0035CAACD9
MNFLTQRVAAANSLLCVGLDPTGADEAVVAGRLREVIEQTAPFAAAFKPNLAFFLARPGGVGLLQEIRNLIPRDIPLILDGKFGDIANTAERYADFAYDVIGADGVTVNPYMGDDAILPFARPGKLVFVLAKTSNQPEFCLQDEKLARGGTLSERTAAVVRALDETHGGSLGLVVGATQPQMMQQMRRHCPQQWFLVPGIGAQGGDLAATLQAGLRLDGAGLLINASRSLWQAADAGAAAEELQIQINQYRAVVA